VTASYLYLFLTLERVPNVHGALATELRSEATRLGGAELVGQFAPQLGWANNEAAVLLRLPAAGGDGALSLAGLVSEVRPEPLQPTIRPADDASPQPGGTYVHRWFEVEAGAVDEFVDLSAQGWETFETLFDARIFGLFRAHPSDADEDAGVARLLLLTRYGDHGVWEASRDPTTEAMQIFARRQQLTRRSWAASSRLTAPA
jgi:hypothetical protein